MLTLYSEKKSPQPSGDRAPDPNSSGKELSAADFLPTSSPSLSGLVAPSQNHWEECSSQPTQLQNAHNRSALWQNIKEGYFKTRWFEANGMLYKALGVGLFRIGLMKAVTKIRPRLKDSPSNYTIGGRSVEAVKDYIKSTRSNESIHLVGCLFSSFPAVPSSTSPVLFDALGMTALAVNVYCVLLQRYNRARIMRALPKLEEREKRRREAS
jgi:hypothetical protein